jgi:hypothetical protein
VRRVWLTGALLITASLTCACFHAVTPAGPTECTSDRVDNLVHQFFTFWSARDVEGVVSLFADSFSLEDRIGEKVSVIQAATELRAYLESRFRVREIFTELIAEIPTHPSPAGANATVRFSRSFDNQRLQGTGKLVCDQGLLTHVLLGSQ